MQTIWKFPLEVTDDQTIHIPKNALPLSIQVQKGTPCLWALVNPHEEKEIWKLRIFGTGHSVEYPGKYIGTFQVLDGNFVGHVFYKNSPASP